jgi:hypothetical protein
MHLVFPGPSTALQALRVNDALHRPGSRRARYLRLRHALLEIGLGPGLRRGTVNLANAIALVSAHFRLDITNQIGYTLARLSGKP